MSPAVITHELSKNTTSNARQVDGAELFRSLPSELISQIVDGLPFASVQSLRLVSKSLTEFASHRLFATILIKEVRKEGKVSKYRSAAEHPKYSDGIKVLASEKPQAFVKRVILKDISHFFGGSDTFDLVVKPETVEIQRMGHYSEADNCLFEPENSMFEILRHLGLGPANLSYEDEDLSQPLPKIKWDLQPNPESCSGAFKLALGHITSLDLRVGWFWACANTESRTPGKAVVAAAFSQMLRHCTQLTSLTLGSYCYAHSPGFSHDYMQLDDFWPRGHVWEHLRSLELDGVFSALTLVNLLRSHVGSIKHLDLRGVLLLLEPAANGDKPCTSESSWEPVKKVICEEMKLTTINGKCFKQFQKSSKGTGNQHYYILG